MKEYRRKMEKRVPKACCDDWYQPEEGKLLNLNETAGLFTDIFVEVAAVPPLVSFTVYATVSIPEKFGGGMYCRSFVITPPRAVFIGSVVSKDTESPLSGSLRKSYY
jgi:hypothetical protein